MSQKLKENAVGFPTALATAVGLIIASPVLLTATTGFGIGGSGFALAIVIAYLLMMAQSTSFAEASAMIPTAGSVYDFLSCGLGRWFAMTGTLAAYLIVHVFAGTAEVAVAGAFAVVNFESLAGWEQSGSWRIGVALIAIFTVINYVGVKVYGVFEVAMTAFMWATLVIFGLVGILSPSSIKLESFFGEPISASSLGEIASMVGLALFLFVGAEFVTPLASEMRNPERLIPRALYVGVSAVAIAMLMYGGAIRRQVENRMLDAESGTRLLDTPLAMPVFSESILGTFGRWWFGAAVLLASAATINTLLASVPRILYGMAREGALPQIFAYLHPRFKTPVVAITAVAAIPAVYAIILDGNVDRILNLVLAAVCAWIVAYILVNLSIIQLRRRRPDLPRPYRAPWFPLPQIVASLGMGLAIWFIAPPGMSRADVYVPFLFMLGSMALFSALWIRLKGWRAFEPQEPEDLLEG